MMLVGRVALGVVLLVSLLGCPPQKIGTNAAPPSPPATNRIAVPPDVVSNIGITFERARRGKVGRWLYVPGRLEVPEDRRWTLRAPARGRVRPRVRQSQTVAEGTVLIVFESPALRAAQKSLLTAASAVTNAESEAQAATARFAEAESVWVHAVELERKLELRRQRIRELRDETTPSAALSNGELLGADRALVDAQERTLRAAVLRDDLRNRSRTLNLEVGRAQIEFERQLAALAVLTGRSATILTQLEDGKPIWETLSDVEIRAPGSGVVMSVAIADGEHVSTGTPMMTLFDPSSLVFRGYLPESDLGSIGAGLPVRVEPAGTENGSILTTLWSAAPVLDDASRTLQVSAWVPNPTRRFPHGLSATAHVQVAESLNEEVLVPEDCVVVDGLEVVVFRRDPDDPNVVIRTQVELGDRGAESIEVLAGVLDGDEVVRNGAHQLKQTGLGKAPEGGHFHADGTWHEGH